MWKEPLKFLFQISTKTIESEKKSLLPISKNIKRTDQSSQPNYSNHN